LTPFVQGLYVSIVGLVVLFIVAAIFYLLLVVLQKIFPGDEKEKAEVTATQAPTATKVSSDDEEIAAVIAAAVINMRQLTQSGLGSSLLENRSTWWSSNLLAAREKVQSKK